MSLSNPFELQASIRAQATDLHAYVQDLRSWQADIKQKDQQLTKGELVLTKSTEMPIRNRADIAADTQSQSSSSPITSKVTLQDTHDEDEELFTECKHRGNEWFKQNDYEKAYDCYTQCIILKTKDVAALANRAMTLLKLDRWEEAEKDCDAVLELDPKHVKGLFRRATARKELGNKEGATKDVNEVLRIEPANKAAKDLQKELTISHIPQSKPSTSSSSSSPTSLSTASVSKGDSLANENKPKSLLETLQITQAISSSSTAALPTESSSAIPKPTRRVLIEEVDDV